MSDDGPPQKFRDAPMVISLAAERAQRNETLITVRVVPSGQRGRVIFEVSSPRMSLTFRWVVSAKTAVGLGEMFEVAAREAGEP